MRWFASDRSTKTTSPTSDEPQRRFVPKRLLSCHGEPEMRLGFVKKDGTEVALEDTCPACRKAMVESAEAFAWRSASGELGKLADTFLEGRGVKLNWRGEIRGGKHGRF